MTKALFLTALLVCGFATANDKDKLGSSASQELSFNEGEAALTSDKMDEVKRVVEEAKAMGPISEVKIISWADREYPADGEKASKDSIKLADRRADNVKKYLKDTLKVRSVKTYNMASRPNALQDMFNTSQAKVKEKMEKSGAAPTTGDTGIFDMGGKSSKALVLVYTKGNPNKL